MTRIKLCGLSQPCDIEAANALRPDYIGFVFAPASRRYVPPDRAALLRWMLAPGILAVGVFVDEAPEQVAALLDRGVIDLAQLHGREDEVYLRALRRLTAAPVIQAFRPVTAEDVGQAVRSTADYLLFDAGSGSGKAFDWHLVNNVGKPYFLAGGLTPGNVGEAVRRLAPYAVDVSSGIETGGRKDKEKMAAFVAAVRKEGSP